jgi:hypothetical protein
MEVRSGKKYEISLIALDSGGQFIAQSEPCVTKLDLTAVDNMKPLLTEVYFTNQTTDFVQTNKIQISGWPNDVTATGSTSKLQSFDCYLIPLSYTAVNYYTKEFLQSVNEYKQTITQVQGEYNSNFSLYSGNVDGACRLVFYLEDENHNYTIKSLVNSIKFFIADYVPTVELSGSNIKITAGKYSQQLCKAQDAPSEDDFYGDWASEDFQDGWDSFEYKKEDKLSIKRLLNTNKWGELKGGINDQEMINESDELWYYNIPYDNSSKARFLKITGKFSSGYKVSSNFVNNHHTVFMKPVYVYTDYLYYKGTDNEIVCKSKGVMPLLNGYQIFADQPCFVHICSCPRLLTSSKTQEDIDEWEARGYEVGLVCNDGTSGNFTYDDSYAEDVPSGWYYTTIVHFADGTAVMSEVKQKQ